jgi:tryptophanyl-tRNA synthetase
MANPAELEMILREGAAKVRPESQALLEKVRTAVGLRSFS